MALNLGLTPSAHAEDGYDLWLRYQAPHGTIIESPSAIVTPCNDASASLLAGVSEVQRAFKSLTGMNVPHQKQVIERSIVLVSPSCNINYAGLPHDFTSYRSEEFRLQRQELSGKRVTQISAQTDVAVLYGVFDYLRMISRGDNLGEEVHTEAPSVRLTGSTEC